MPTILVAEDEPHVRVLIEARLRPHFTVLGACDGEEALGIIDRQPVDLLVSDVMMPKIDGFELVKRLRQGGSDMPVLLLTARQALSDKHIGFSSGTDDYMTKPIQYDELLWRIRALLRRARIHADHKIDVGAVSLDARSWTLRRDALSISLPRKEFEVLFKLLSYPGQIFTKAQLLEEIWGMDSDSSEDTVKTHVSRLREKVSAFPEFEIVTLKGLGYKAEVHGDERHDE